MVKTVTHRSFIARVLIFLVGVMFTLIYVDAKASPSLSYFVKEGPKCLWYYWDSLVPTESNLLAKLPRCPELVFFDSQQNTVYFNDGDTIFSLPLKQHASQPSQFASLPKVKGEKRVLWNDKSNGKLRLLVVSDVAEKDVVRKDGKIYFRNVDGMLIEGSNKGAFIGGVSYAPMWEHPQLLTIFELVADDKWQRKAELASEIFFGLSRAEEVWKEGATNWHDVEISPNWNERGISNYSALTDICENETESHCLNSALPDFVNTKAQARVANYFSKLKKPDLFYVSFKQANTAIVFDTIFGHTLHAVLPLLFCKNECMQQTPLDIRASTEKTQVRLSPAYPFLLVVEDDATNGNNPNVIDVRTGKIVYRTSGFGAMWMSAP